MRKVRRYAELHGGPVWKEYKSADEMDDFFRLARKVSVTTYQEKLVGAGLPDSEAFCRELKALAAEGRVRGFILFDRDRPVSYLYCPIIGRTVIYQYLGYDPEYSKFSVGTVLQWLALHALFDEGGFRLFDFTEGESEHKRLFATHSVYCANVFFIRMNPGNRILLQGQIAIDGLSRRVGEMLDRLGYKARVKRLIRFGR